VDDSLPGFYLANVKGQHHLNNQVLPFYIFSEQRNFEIITLFIEHFVRGIQFRINAGGHFVILMIHLLMYM